MLKRRMSQLAMMVLLLLLFCSTAYAVDMTLTIDAPNTLPTVGESFTVVIRVTDNPGLCAVQYTLSFDPTVVSCQEIQLGAVLSGMLSATNPTAQSGAIVAAASVVPASSDGVLGYFTFQVLREGDGRFSLIDTVFGDAMGNKVSAYVVNEDSGAQSGQTPTLPVVPGNQTRPNEPNEPNEPENPNLPVIPGTQPSDSLQQPEQEKDSVAGSDSVYFPDVTQDFWGYVQIQKAAEQGIVNGYEDGTFRPEVNVTRGQFVTMLWRMAGKPPASVSDPFTDTITLDEDFRTAIAWAAEQGIIKGVSATEFAPESAISRQQVMTILFRYSGGISGMEQILADTYNRQFSDSNMISADMKSAVYWAVYHGIVNGVTENLLDPQGPASRAQIVVILMRYAEKIMG